MECPLILQNLCFQPLYCFVRIQKAGFKKSDRAINIIIRYRADMHIDCLFRRFPAAIFNNELQPLHIGAFKTVDGRLLLR